MFAPACRTSLRTVRSSRRSFVSTVLLSKTYDDKTVAELRQDLRSRGLAVSGSKATLITRVTQDDKRAASEAFSAPSQPPQTLVRGVSSTPAARAEPTSLPSSSSSRPDYLNVKIPDASQEQPERPIAIPFYHDFWNSSAVKAQEQAPLIPEGPKISLAAGADTYHAGGPTFNLSSAAEVTLSSLPSSAIPSLPKKYTGIVGDVLNDLGIPHDVLKASPTVSETSSGRTQSRPLDAEEQRGVYVLLGLLFGSWVVAGIAAPSGSTKIKAEKH